MQPWKRKTHTLESWELTLMSQLAASGQKRSLSWQTSYQPSFEACPAADPQWFTRWRMWFWQNTATDLTHHAASFKSKSELDLLQSSQNQDHWGNPALGEMRRRYSYTQHRYKTHSMPGHHSPCPYCTYMPWCDRCWASTAHCPSSAILGLSCVRGRAGRSSCKCTIPGIWTTSFPHGSAPLPLAFVLLKHNRGTT